MSLGSRFAHWFDNVAISLDILGNAIAGGVLRMTISKRAALARDRGRRWGCVLCAILGWIDPQKNPDHCTRAKMPNPADDGSVATD